MIEIHKRQAKEIKKIFAKVYKLADQIDDMQKKTLMYCDELKDLSDQLELVLVGRTEKGETISKGLKMKTKKAFKEAGKSSKYGKWEGNL